MTELLASEEILLHLIEEVLRVGIDWHILYMLGRSCHPARLLDHKLGPEKNCGTRTLHNMVAHDPIVTHAQADVSRLQIPFHCISNFSWHLRLHVKPRLGFAAVLAGIAPALVRTPDKIEEDNVHGSWAESCQLQVVRYHKLIIWSMSTLQCDALRAFIILLLWLLRPRVIKTTRGPILQAIHWRARVDVQVRLDRAEQKTPQ